MAIYHLSASIVSRNKGMSAVAKSSYNSCDKIKNEYDGTIHNYSNKPYHTYHEILLPENAPREYMDKAKLWNSVELSEKSKNAQLCRSFDIALPKELSKEEQEKLIHDYCKENFSDKGMCVQIDVHSTPENPHAHVMTTLREIDENGKWKAKRKDIYKLDENGERIPVIDKKTGLQKTDSRNRKQWERETVKTNDWDSKDFLLEVRKNWSEKCNEKLKEKGVAEISHLSYEDREFYKQPQIHLGSYNHKLMKEGKTNERIEQYQNIMEQNRQIREIRQKFNLFFEKLKKDMSRPTHSRADLLLKSKQREEYSQMSLEQLRQKREDNLILMDSKKKEISKLPFYKLKERAKIKEQIDNLEEKNYELDRLINERKKAPDTTTREQRMEQRKSVVETLNEKLKQVQAQEQTPERLQLQQQRKEQTERFNKLFSENQYGIKPRKEEDRTQNRDTSKPIVKQLPKEYSQNREHDVGNPLEKSQKEKAKDRKTETRTR